MNKYILWSYIILYSFFFSIAGCANQQTLFFRKPLIHIFFINSENNSTLMQMIKEQLYFNNIKLINSITSNNIFYIQLNKEIIKTKIFSIQKNNVYYKYLIKIILTGKIIIKNYKEYPINIKVSNFYLDNFLFPLSIDSQKNFLYQELRYQITEILIKKIFLIYEEIKNNIK